MLRVDIGGTLGSRGSKGAGGTGEEVPAVMGLRGVRRGGRVLCVCVCEGGEGQNWPNC